MQYNPSTHAIFQQGALMFLGRKFLDPALLSEKTPSGHGIWDDRIVVRESHRDHPESKDILETGPFDWSKAFGLVETFC